VLGDGVLVAVVIDRTVVDEPPALVEEKHLRRSLGAVTPGYGLILVVEVVKVEALRLGARLHLVERVGRVALSIVGADRHQPEAADAVVLLDRLHPALPPLDVRAVVARPDDREDGRLGVVVEGMISPVDAGQLEVRRFRRHRQAHCNASSICSRVGTGETRPFGRR
jgi:hypothetical protein